MGFQSEVTELRPIEECFVPLLKFKYEGIEIDMTFARLHLPEVGGLVFFIGSLWR